MKLGQSRRLKTEKSREQKALVEEQKQIGWRRRIKAVEWRACKAEDEVKQLRMENEELKKAVAAGGQPEVTDPTLKGADPEVIIFCLQADVDVQKGQLRELHAHHKELQAGTEQLQQRLRQETVLLAAAQERVQEAEQRRAAVQVGGQQKLQRQEQQIEQLVKQLQEQAEGAQSREQELSQVRAELQSRVSIVNGGSSASAVCAGPNPQQNSEHDDRLTQGLSSVMAALDAMKVAPLAQQVTPVWTACYDQCGRMYWHDSSTGCTQWHSPF